MQAISTFSYYTKQRAACVNKYLQLLLARDAMYYNTKLFSPLNESQHVLKVT